VLYETRVSSLIYDGERVSGVRARHKGKATEFRAKVVVLACGGFEANPEMRTRYLGPGWELCKVRGSRFNVGDDSKMALDIGAAPMATGRAANATAGTATRRNSATSASATSSRSTAISSAC